MPAKRKATTSQTLDEPDATRRRTRSHTANLSSPSRETQLQDPNASQPPTSSVRRPSTRSVPLPSPTRKERGKLLTRSQAKAPLGRRADSPSDQEDADSEDELLLSPTMKKKKRQETKPSQLPRVYVEIISPAPHPSKRLLAKTNADPSSPTPTRPKALQTIPPSPSRSPIPLKKTTANRMSQIGRAHV